MQDNCDHCNRRFATNAYGDVMALDASEVSQLFSEITNLSAQEEGKNSCS